MKMKRELFYRSSSLGVVGTKTDKKLDEYLNKFNLYVGDVIAFEAYDKIYVNVVTQDSNSGRFGVFGFGNNHLDFEKITRILTYDFLTEEMLKNFASAGTTRRGLHIKETEDIKEMTIKEVESIIGHRVKIISDNPSDNCTDCV